jgi:hypothetical protein
MAGRAGAGRGVLAGGPAVRLLFALALFLLALLLLSLVFWVSVSRASTTRCTTYEERSLGRLQTLCDNGTRELHTWNRPRSRWESTVTGRRGRPAPAAQPQDPPMGGTLSMTGGTGDLYDYQS